MTKSKRTTNMMDLTYSIMFAIQFDIFPCSINWNKIEFSLIQIRIPISNPFLSVEWRWIRLFEIRDGCMVKSSVHISHLYKFFRINGAGSYVLKWHNLLDINEVRKFWFFNVTFLIIHLLQAMTRHNA